MFGYVRPLKPMLRICEYDTYKAVYCGLCKQLSRSYGLFARWTLSYDFAFLALLDMALQEEAPQFSKESCLYNPFKKRACCICAKSLERSAAAAMLMLYYKVLDNIADENIPKKWAYRMILPFVRRARRKARKDYGALDDFIGAQMKDQAVLEQNNCGSVDRASEPSANCLAALFELLSENSGQRRALKRLGYLMGRWVYLMDALDDMEQDIENKRFNPFAACMDGECPEGRRESAVLSLNLTVGEIVKTYGLLDLHRYGDILSNILDLGLKSTMNQILIKARAENKLKEKKPND